MPLPDTPNGSIAPVPATPTSVILASNISVPIAPVPVTPEDVTSASNCMVSVPIAPVPATPCSSICA